MSTTGKATISEKRWENEENKSSKTLNEQYNV